jgi:hypothetical protein
MNFITVNDFIGEIALDLSNDANVMANFEAIGTQVIYDVLNDLMGASLYNALIADLTAGQPQTTKYIELVNGKTYTDSAGKTINYEGIKRMLKYFVYETYLDLQYSNNTSLGQVSSLTENSKILDRGTLRKVRAKIQNKAVILYNRVINFLDYYNSEYFTGNDYSFWQPSQKRYIGKITTITYSNSWYYNKSSDSI